MYSILDDTIVQYCSMLYGHMEGMKHSDWLFTMWV